MNKSFVLSIGIDEYKSDSIPNLSWAKADARAFLEATIGGRAPTSIESRLLLDDHATTVAIREAFGEWLATAGQNDTVIAFFAGHGGREIRAGGRIPNDIESYLIPVDGNRSHLYSTAVSLTNEFPILARRLASENVILILDCCLSGRGNLLSNGARARGIDGSNLAMMETLSDIPLNSSVVNVKGQLQDVGEGASMLMACGPNQAALESDELKHGVFTYHLLDLIEEQRSRGEDVLPLGDLYAQVVKSVVQHTGGRQVPMLEGRLAGQQLFVGGSS
jgi:uncharacterized caspase-like protein